MKLIKNKFFIGIVVFFIVAGSWFAISINNSTQKNSYDTSEVLLGDISIVVEATGTVQPENRLVIRAPIPGRMDEILSVAGALVKKGQIIAWMSSTERSALLDAARAKGDKEFKRWEKLYRPTPIISPIDGTIIFQKIEAGQSFSTADDIFILSNRLTVKAQVDETDIAKVKKNQSAQIILDAYSSSIIPASVGNIAYDATTVNNITTYLVDVVPSIIPEHMKSGMTANVKFLVQEKKSVLLIPNAAIQETKDHSTQVQLVLPNKVFELKKIITGITNGKSIEVVEGLKQGDIILIKNLSTNDEKKSSSPFSPSRRSR